jgi:dihydrofolate synthase
LVREKLRHQRVARQEEQGEARSEFLQKLREQRAIEGLKLGEAKAPKMSSDRLPIQQDNMARSELSPTWKVPATPLPSSSPPIPTTAETSSSPRIESQIPPKFNLERELASSSLGESSPVGAITTPNTTKVEDSTSSVPPETSAVKSDISPDTETVQAPPTSLPINLGLERITALLEHLGNPQDHLKVIHVAGTNGKGSTCAYITSSLIAADKKVGQFTSPHLVDRWDGITINSRPIDEKTFLKLEQQIKSINDSHDIKASTFEVLTACALSYFAQENVHLAVIETGMGGSLDATNVFKPENVLVSIITPISLDHMQYLGDTVQAIAKHKAGIIKQSVPVVVAPQAPQVQNLLQEIADEKKAKLTVGVGYWKDNANTRYIVENVRFDGADPNSIPLLTVVPGMAGAEQGVNIACAVNALSLLKNRGIMGISERAVQSGIAAAYIPGRMEWIRFETQQGQVPMLLDGAHNPASCSALGAFVGNLRTARGNKPVVWVVGFSEGRNVSSCLSKFVEEGDYVACVEFGPVDGMPWVRPVDGNEVATQAKVWSRNIQGVVNFGTDIVAAIRWGVQQTKAKNGMLAGTGSLYLVSDIHRLRRRQTESESESNSDSE